MNIQKEKNRICLYCGHQCDKMTNEHVIPDAIGGSKYIAPVCNRCNNGPLSEIDRQLCSFSPVALVAAQKMVGQQKKVLDFWTIDEQRNDLLIEGIMDYSNNTSSPYPQIIVEGDRIHFRADGNDIYEMGSQNAFNHFKNVIAEAFLRHEKRKKSRKKAIIFEQFDSRLITNNNRRPPRIFSRHKLTELKVGDTVILRYSDEEDKRNLLNKLSKGICLSKKTYSEFYAAGQKTAFRFDTSLLAIGQAFMKIGINALASVCRNTEVNLKSFPYPFGVITGKIIDDNNIINRNGFIKASDLSQIGDKSDEHYIRILRDNNIWVVVTSLFGGSIGGIASFPGPSNESWRFMEIKSPINTPHQIVKESSLYVPCTWKRANTLREIAPDLPVFNIQEEHYFLKKKQGATPP